ncbi:hypothetical protein [Streptomyces sp. NPDC048489]|uniref:hypothetical protein n=1 Tax=Streptomyces sp. NPDC048489 TaxID=3154504 RepID=UPI003428BD19
MRKSSLCGGLSWPAGQPWPYCAQEGHWTFGSDWHDNNEKVRDAVPILQLFARDIPG